ncbi:hypothetical protein [Microvirga tunisiensis]|uniref:Uncharacterized protein n=1 Tax=Microvirga tunisiensis TaxID=2108360 RepID=A0A5N7MB82_9HYPH|nr:hypothetical protein [Microvirga tunisiensis]MPR06319.1 hypothetical protein [Microvirga tunisiensis]MPR24105.1 hypothetical protein [Microvirga tunisiensis]
MIKRRFFLVAGLTLSLGACVSDGTTAITTVSPHHCFYDSNQARNRCSSATSVSGYAPNERRAYRHRPDYGQNPISGLGSVLDPSPSAPAGSDYTFGYNSGFEAGYRYPRRFVTTIYEGTEVIEPLPETRAASVKRPSRSRKAGPGPVYKD